MNKSQYILVAIAALLALFVFTMSLFSFFRPLDKTSVTQSIPTPTSSEIKPITYDPSASEKMIEMVNTRTPFGSKDAAIREQLALRAESNSILYTSTNVKVEYLSSPDQFMAEILTPEIDTAKNEAVSYLSSVGLSPDAICHLPLVFYLSVQARRLLPENSPAFNPLAPSC